MSRQATHTSYPNLIKRFVFNDEATTLREGATLTNVTFDKGKAVFAGTGFAAYDLPLNGVFSIRFVLTSYTSTNYQALWAADTTGISEYPANTIGTLSGATNYVNGVPTSTLTSGVKNDIIVTGATLTNKSIFYVGGTSGSTKLTGEVDFIEIYEGTLTASEVANLYSGKWNKELPINNTLLDFNSTQGVLKDSTVGNVVGGDLVTNGSFSINYDGWASYLATVEIVDNSLALTSTSNWGKAFRSISLTEGKLYRIKGWAKSVVGNTCYIMINTSYGASWDGTAAITTSNTEWTKLSKVFVCPAGFSSIYMMNNTQCTTNFKDISVVEIRPELSPSNVTLHKTGNNYASLFNGTTSYIDTGSDMVGTKAVTVMGWIKPYGWGEGVAGKILDNGKTSLNVSDGGSGIYELRFSSNYSTIADSADDSIVFNNQTFFSVTRTSAGVVNIYIGDKNTAPTLSGSADQNSGTPAVGTTNLIIGNRLTLDRTFDGLIQTLKIVEGILPLEDISRFWSETRKDID